MDGGRDFFKILTEGNKAAQRDNALIVEVGVGDGRQAVATASLGSPPACAYANAHRMIVFVLALLHPTARMCPIRGLPAAGHCDHHQEHALNPSVRPSTTCSFGR